MKVWARGMGRAAGYYTPLVHRPGPTSATSHFISTQPRCAKRRWIHLSFFASASRLHATPFGPFVPLSRHGMDRKHDSKLFGT